MPRDTVVEASRDGVTWPWFAGGFLAVFAGGLLRGPLPPHLAEGLAFFVGFSAASFLVSRATPRHQPLARHATLSAVGGVLVAVLRYLFP